MSHAPVQIAVVGHTNTGKTSLLRTLTRDVRFGEVSDRPATTRDVHGVTLLADGQAVVALYDTPGLEDALGVASLLQQRHAEAADPVAAIDAFLAGDHDHGRYEQEAKALRQVRDSEAALYVIDAREPVLAKHREELRLLAACGRPLLPVLNFIADPGARPAEWKAQAARFGLHVLAEFDTVVYDHQAEQRLFDTLGLLLESRRSAFVRLLRSRAQERDALIDAASRTIAELLANAAGARRRSAPGEDPQPAAESLRQAVRTAEQRCVDTLLDLFRFDLDAYQPPALPLAEGRWTLDIFDPDTLRTFGVRATSAAAAGGMAGLTIDAAVGGMSLGAAAALGATLGAGWTALRDFGRPWLDRARGYQELALEEPTLALLATRQTLLLSALLRRGHASQTRITEDSAPTSPETASAVRTRTGWPSAALRSAVLRARAQPDFSSLNLGADAVPHRDTVQRIAAEILAFHPGKFGRP